MDLERQMEQMENLPEQNYRGVVCNKCGKEGLHWKDIEGKWKLVFGNGRLHNCFGFKKTTKLK